MVLINHKSYSDPVISHSVALVLVMHFAQCGAVCVTTYWCVSRDASGMQKKKKTQRFCSHTTLVEPRAERGLYSVFSINMVHTWMLFSYPFDKLR